MSPPETGRNGADWLKPRVEQQGLQRYITTLRERAWLVLATVLLTTAAAAAYVLLADKVYKAEADVLVTPVSREDPTVTGLGLIQESSDPTRDVETAARLVTTTDVARRVQRKLRIGGSPTALLEDVTAEPVAQSNIVAVAAEAGSARQAQALANAFGEGVI